ncbi:MAG TPA: D-alanyl-D-alanine carboxypeptidase/D-alanyl-D-alanine-endopeptidase [Burkholderiaceae bacterium]|nr:D-alanyl-D-alanine carboxypeptidase/D-alanyl-D-alanine-endopeptidase [Burkholderiaceae bacterium]
MTRLRVRAAWLPLLLLAALISPASFARAIAATGLPSQSFGLYAQEVIGARIVLALNDERPYMMGSTTKIVTSLAALDLLGPYYRWHTSAYAMGPLADGRLAGDLLIVGGGNAQLTSAELARWFKRMHDQGLRTIDGDIVLDRYAFQLRASDHAGTPRPSASEPRHVWPDAMTLDEGLIGIVVQPARGARAAVALKPALSDVRVDNRLTMGGGCSATPLWQAGRNGQATVVVSGSWSAACGTRRIDFVPPPDSGIAARALPAMWAATGGVLRGRVVSAAVVPGVSPIPRGADGEPARPLSFDRSKPLTELVRDINKTSDNVGARNLMLSLSPGFPARPATLAGARRVIGLWLRDQGLGDDDIEVENGSGLSHGERAKPRALVQLLRKAWRADQAQAFFESLPVAGVDGTLKNRLLGGRATGQAYLKTGTLNDTRALAGYVHGASGKMYAVALIVNHADPARGRPALDAMVEWLARNG